jgi:hypothetical protein
MFPHAVDSTMLASFRSCPQKTFRQYMEHWKPKNESVHLVAGGAFASGVEAARKGFYEQGMSVADAEAAGLTALIKHYGDFEPPADSAKSLDRMCGALEFYFSHYPLGEDGCEPVLLPNGKRAIEFSFAEPLPIPHPVTGDPILYTGRADAIMNFAGGRYITDEKTASSLGASWAKQWEMRSQFTGYCWASAQAGLPVDGTLVRGVSILKTKYDTLQAVTYRGSHEIARWLDQTCRDIQRWIRMWEEGHYDFSLDHACAEYGGCSMVSVCKSPDPETWLPMYFTKRVWDPLARREMTVEEYEASWGEGGGELTSGITNS